MSVFFWRLFEHFSKLFSPTTCDLVLILYQFGFINFSWKLKVEKWRLQKKIEPIVLLMCRCVCENQVCLHSLRNKVALWLWLLWKPALIIFSQSNSNDNSLLEFQALFDIHLNTLILIVDLFFFKRNIYGMKISVIFGWKSWSPVVLKAVYFCWAFSLNIWWFIILYL